MALPKRERSFYFDMTDDLGEKFDGTFTIKCRLNMAEKYAYELEKSRLLADQANPSVGLFNTATIMAHLHSRIVDGPNWWIQGKGNSIEDESVFIKLYDKVNEEIEEWYKDLKKVAIPDGEQGN